MRVEVDLVLFLELAGNWPGNEHQLSALVEFEYKRVLRLNEKLVICGPVVALLDELHVLIEARVELLVDLVVLFAI